MENRGISFDLPAGWIPTDELATGMREGFTYRTATVSGKLLIRNLPPEDAMPPSAGEASGAIQAYALEEGLEYLGVSERTGADYRAISSLLRKPLPAGSEFLSSCFVSHLETVTLFNFVLRDTVEPGPEEGAKSVLEAALGSLLDTLTFR